MDSINKPDQQTAASDSVNREKRRALIITSALGSTAALGVSYPLVRSMQPSERARAVGAPVSVATAPILPGQLKTTTWQGKPVWILHRTPEMIVRLSAITPELADPNSDMSQQPAYASNELRSIDPKFFVAVAICTHLGCIPSFNPEPADKAIGANWPGGFFCPCHGSKFDFAGRVFKNVPAPTNLVIPPYRIHDSEGLIIG